jgi:thiamine-phosphate pyrophosphorylase
MSLNSMRIAGLYVLTDPAAGGTEELLSRVDAVLRGGAAMIQYRDKSQDRVRRRHEATAIRDLCHRHAAVCIINDDIELAAEIEADGVHIGRDDAGIALARQTLGSTAIIGVSCYDSLDLAQQAAAAGADYVAFGSFFPSASKPDAVPAPISLLQNAKQQLRLPIVAIGGIGPDNAGRLIEAGADAIAVIGSVFLAEKPYDEARRLAALFKP